MSSNGTHQEYPAIQMLRAIAALSVVVFHSKQLIKCFDNCYWLDKTVSRFPIANHLDLGVDVFFCISGFIMAMILFGSESGVVASLQFMKKRLFRIIPPYWLFSIFIILVYYASSRKLNISQMTGLFGVDVLRIIKSLLLVPQRELPVLGVGWTLVYEFQFYLICSLLILVSSGRRLISVLIVLSAVSLFAKYLGVSYFYSYFPTTYYFEFLAGALAYKWKHLVSSRMAIYAMVACGVLCVAYCYSLDGVFTGLSRFGVKAVKPFVMSVIGFLFVVSSISIDRNYGVCATSVGRYFCRIGNASYFLYVYHWIALSFLGKAFSPLHSLNLAFVIFAHISGVIAVVFGAVYLSEKFEIPFHRRLLNGGN